MKRDEMGGVFRTRERDEKVLVGKAEQIRQLRK
jgi:hypothetical protein